jgi:hypothetical protein
MGALVNRVLHVSDATLAVESGTQFTSSTWRSTWQRGDFKGLPSIIAEAGPVAASLLFHPSPGPAPPETRAPNARRPQHTSRKPLTALAGNAVCQNGGEIRLTVRGTGSETARGSLTTTPFTKTVSSGGNISRREADPPRRTTRVLTDALRPHRARP